MNSQDVYGFSADRPILEIEEDLLGRAKFSEDLADAIAGWRGKDSIVVALHGEWGSGKSSIKNMAVSKLKSLTENRPDIVEFSPWQWAAQDKITASFFQEISKSIGRIDTSKDGKKLAAALKKYGRYLTAGESVATGLATALPALFVLAILTGIGSSFFDAVWVENTSVILLSLFALLAAFLKWGRRLLNILSGNVEASAKDQEQSLDDIRQDLTSLLAKRKSSLIIVMDDLDRLTSDQLRMIFQLVKANLEFPNVVFFLLFQRDLIEEKLTDKNQSGREYLEKIIQVPLDIPKIEKTKVHNILFNGLDSILNQNESAVKMFNFDRWHKMFYSALHEYFDNLRGVYRYISTFSFHFSIFKEKSVFEVNPVDLIAIECLRVFEPEIYKEIYRLKDIFTGSGSDMWSGSGIYPREKDATKSIINGVLNMATENKQEAVKKLLSYLFPPIRWALEGTHYVEGTGDNGSHDMRVCHEFNFDKYFQFSIPEGQLSHSNLQEMLFLTSNSAKFSAFVLSLQEGGILKNALMQFASFTDDIPLSNGNTYVKALLDIGDEVDHEHIGFVSSSHAHVVALVVWFLNRIENKTERGKLLFDCFENSEGVSIVEHILQSDENYRKNSESDILLRDEEFDSIKKEFVNKLDSMAQNSPDSLLQHDHLVSFLHRWRRWGDEGKVVEWLKSQIESADGCITLLKKFVHSSSQSRSGLGINLEDVENCLGVDFIVNRINGIDETKLDSEGKNVLQPFKDLLSTQENSTTDDRQ